MPLQIELYLEDCFDDSTTAVNIGDNYPIPLETWENWFQQWLENLFDYLPTAPSYEISLRLTNDTEMQTLNSQYRQQDKPTDVLAFACLEADLPQSEEMLDSMPLYLGDIIVSIDTAKRQAQQQEHSLSTELAWLTAHGLLHLLGWDHPDEESLIQMLNEQVVLLKKIGIIINLES
ncbi:rRNA maturation RNase YbeY [Dolichospermum sp. ST_con]|nr:rRNA maturation RNase YbeY [Dolichospermum sp. ST_con]MDD1421884.1 rRNA maturation RNase YbeY [Dolichospermum sp. ST_sed1]MDD1427869.1 rRNA maturation RNase YbeY [Dolichospermum sp. ST_sed9]MDD1430719.1 rRNA maturation RNase YbeY [Dolichospermum sp. ST_sed6]MDD1437683.1 rRNA maturation RNase YbeY [Dolichospermum sp. ST_sed10]MDD1443179.1 rRNA maturation RNase YbeY [Dolichospermum sp. ST_sed3]MDD1448997.1 rRNA maturation RNase YbeY [Dolichospermum sp. ST_sed8]MDD1457558.1 rRNA maturation R